VEFLDYCMHSQVVNYVQWGAMNKLCGNEIQAAIAHMGRSTWGARWRSGEFETPYYEEQKEMVRVGDEFVGIIQRLYRDPDVLNNPGYYTPEKIREIAAAELRRGMENRIGGGIVEIDWDDRIEYRCKLPCVLDAAARRRLDQWPWKYNWLGLSDDRGSDRYERRAKPEED
jgi:hypothetical protein